MDQCYREVAAKYLAVSGGGSAVAARDGRNVKKSSHVQSELARLFSSAVFRELASNGSSPTFRRLVDKTDLDLRCPPTASVADAFDEAFRMLTPVGDRHEYVYRSAVLQKILLGRHSLRTSSVLNEFRMGSCRADIVVLNGTATVYEIKTERDSLVRLANQIDSYRTVFGSVNVISSDIHLRNIISSVPEDVGILSLSKDFQISTVRKAKDCPCRIMPVVVFESLRSTEARLILHAMGIEVPQVPNTQIRSVMREVFEHLDASKLHQTMIEVLKKSRSQLHLSELISVMPRSLHANVLSIPVRKSDSERLVDAVQAPLKLSSVWR